MNKSILFVSLLLVLGVVLVAGCLGNNSTNNTTNNTTNNSSNAVLAPPDPISAPADTAMYRGNVVKISVANNTTIVTLEQAKGTNFGAAVMNFTFTNNSRTNFNLSNLTVGRYVEVYYGTPSDGAAPNPATAVVANLLSDAGYIIYNGEIVSVTPAADASLSNYTGKLEVKLENNTTMIFNCGENTRFYISTSNLTAGTHVNIRGNYVIQLSEPPQNTAFEVRAYSSAT